MSASVWWVNHTQTVRHEIEGSYLWLPSAASRSKARAQSERNVQRLSPGDVVFSCADGAVGAVGVVLASARQAARPAEFDSLEAYSDAPLGWHVPVRFMQLANALHPADHRAELAPVLPRKHAPILASGAVNRHMHLAGIPAAMAETLQRLLGGEVQRIVETITEAAGRSLLEEAAELLIHVRVDITAAQRAELLRSRNGQGLFRAHVEQSEHGCRITGALDRRHLCARHIKPWSRCTDAERLDGSNGLLLSPHVAHLFERGYVSFADDGELLVSRQLNPVVLENWHIRLPLNVGEFDRQQCGYLDFHRREIFQQHGAGRRRRPDNSFEEVPMLFTGEPTVVEVLAVEPV